MLRWLNIMLPMAILATGLGLSINDPTPVQQLRLLVFDTYQRLDPRKADPEDAPVRVVDIDDQSLERLGQWPWPRTLLARIIERLNDLGAAAIAMDVVFSEPDRTSPEQLLKQWPDTPATAALRERLTDMQSHDAAFARAIAAAPVVTGFVLTEKPNSQRPAIKAGLVYAGDNPRQFIPAFSGAVVNLPVLRDAATGNGALNWKPDFDSVVRRAPLLVRLGEHLYPTLSAEALRVAQGARSFAVKSSGASGETAFGEATGINAVRIGGFVVPTDAHGQVVLHFAPHSEKRFIPAWKLLQPDFDPSEVKGRIIFIGTSASGLKDIRATPLGVSMPGVEIHAQLIEQILSKQFLRRPDWMGGAEKVFLVALGLLLIIVGWYANALWAALFGAVALGAAVTSSWLAFKDLHILADPVFPSVTVLFIYVTQTVLTYFRTEFERRQVRTAFSRYMSPDLVERLAENPKQLALGGEMKEMTLLFCDIRGFTAISESYDAVGLTRFINDFLTPMTDVILRSRGTIDKYIGDCIMAFWNAPLDDGDHARHACEAALDMRAELARLNSERQRTADAAGERFVPITVGIGLNTGVCCVGNMGSEQRFDYSVLGDDVNLASRLEGQSKTYGVDIIVGEKTRDGAPGFAWLELDLIRVMGKSQPVRIFHLMGGMEAAADPAFVKLAERHEAMLEAYRDRDWAAAGRMLRECDRLDASGTLGQLYALYEQRIKECRTRPPKADWDGVFVALEK